MKKFLSILLAAILVCSMGIFAFAADEEAFEDTDAAVVAAAEEDAAPAEEATVAAAGDLTSLEKKIAEKGLDSTDMSSLLSSAISSIGKNIKEISVNDILNLPANIMDDVVTYIFAGLKALGVDVDALYEKLSSNKIINWFVNTFYKGKALTTAPAAVDEPTPIPQTGSVASVAVFATLSLAAAAAFVSFKKKEA
jgi:LPXTG-motif cell wall-anchored protein